ncbi:conserved hypothetical protein [Talaromyces stipitatus ATCC 10500]|uniref:Uncharacterized protein n=1 Tax=Talaromyces stipitatus (strain ATCC 10500 / CBS 375.48 / QM 6759 / NRRL 1006) TaxID=441959 RepID=B8MI07_TALSN|nr:uncharacterized protein TSTA_022230 [Talaromyces stipitatus ATCC 10500]EED17169.1 conserved hypothetical protein [Talaromyces stipitatus ATCC 10500]
MADAMVEESATTTRSGRVITPSTRAREASGSDNISAVRTSKKSMTQVELTAVKKAAGLIEEKQSGKDGNRDMLKKIGQYLESTYQEVKGLKEVLIKQEKMIKEQSKMIQEQSSTIQALQTQLYPVKIDNANQTVILDRDSNVLPGAIKTLGKENNVDIAKISWLSKKDTNKAYGSMVVYVTKWTDAKHLIEGNYFDIGGESAYTRIFKP